MSAQGAGIQAAQVISSLGVSAVIAGNLGPNAHQALSAAGIKVYACAGETVRNAVNLFNAGSLQEISAPTVAAHFGMNAAPGQGSGQGPGSGMGAGGGMGAGEAWVAEAAEAADAADSRQIERREVKCQEWMEQVPPDRDL